jgi:hypothetical protein
VAGTTFPALTGPKPYLTGGATTGMLIGQPSG